MEIILEPRIIKVVEQCRNLLISETGLQKQVVVYCWSPCYLYPLFEEILL
ncbi:hypothetical protein PM8797T_31668 [Gimesia maris DSM 8797]|jgi:hypothetical protein|uniref:Uncharacterized protein n=1 Tax=Gimesia maris TaxID=122 RepID=A0ABX5YLU3_9PLAN|nr:hypothetical protein [Gimesia maris]EDL59840.1 hypothetical protein PM8797T_31668 [Gimesia maris DSM 8797]QDT79157.1 hypothetical protein Mal35_26110 [Gimesia maris]QEG16673.1 hypothetical protein GmarT_25390 [Gimesia maris]